jgi:hypothetical protein
MMNHICITCGNQHSSGEQPPARCAICEDERQWVRHAGQAWTTLDELGRSHSNVFNTLEPGLTEIITQPKFAIGQRALLVQTPDGNVLWDCVSLVDDETIKAVEALGGISSLAMSHPHMYASMVEWSQAFGNAPIYLHAANQRWVMRPDPAIEYWQGDSFCPVQGISLYRCGGHFTGSTVLHWPAGAEGRGVLLSSDTLHITQDRKYVSFMYSFPNYIPLSMSAIEGVVDTVAPLEFDRIYSHFSGLVIDRDAKGVVQRSVERYRRAIGC